MLVYQSCHECKAEKPADNKILCADCFNRRWDELLTIAVARGVPIPASARARS